MHMIYGEYRTFQGLTIPVVWYPDIYDNEPDNFRHEKLFAVLREEHTQEPHFTIQENRHGIVFTYDGTQKKVTITQERKRITVKEK